MKVPETWVDFSTNQQTLHGFPTAINIYNLFCSLLSADIMLSWQKAVQRSVCSRPSRRQAGVRDLWRLVWGPHARAHTHIHAVSTTFLLTKKKKKHLSNVRWQLTVFTLVNIHSFIHSVVRSFIQVFDLCHLFLLAVWCDQLMGPSVTRFILVMFKKGTS